MYNMIRVLTYDAYKYKYRYKNTLTEPSGQNKMNFLYNVPGLQIKLLTFHLKTTRVWWCLVSNYSSHYDNQGYEDYIGHRCSH